VDSADRSAITDGLTPESAALFSSLPHGICSELLEDRDPHGNVQVSHIEMGELAHAPVTICLQRCWLASGHGRRSTRLRAFSLVPLNPTRRAEKLLIRLVEAECNARRKEGRFSGKFNALSKFFGESAPPRAESVGRALPRCAK
jgi:hypothetical protein